MNGWPRTLSWSDFTSIPNPGPTELRALNGHPIVARVGLSIMFFIGNSPRVGDGTTFRSVDVRLQVNRLEYVPSRIPAGQEARYLQHEQGHMDLMGLLARELEVALLALRGSSSADLTVQANSTVDQAVNSARMYAINVPRRDCLYDRETNHGMNQPGQTRWNRLIAQNIARSRESDFIFRT
ncbi:MAG: DUF922 domain-containing protein [Pyrinomonadaceae bacterium]